MLAQISKPDSTSSGTKQASEANGTQVTEGPYPLRKVSMYQPHAENPMKGCPYAKKRKLAISLYTSVSPRGENESARRA